MSEAYFIPEAPGAPPVSVVPTERLAEIVRAHHRYVEALIEIAANFAPQIDIRWDGQEVRVGSLCGHCSGEMEDGCYDGCPGLLARRALGVA